MRGKNFKPYTVKKLGSLGWFFSIGIRNYLSCIFMAAGINLVKKLDRIVSHENETDFLFLHMPDACYGVFTAYNHQKYLEFMI